MPTSPYALGGLIGGLFFAGYMLTQFPGGCLGDKYGHRTIIAISLIWAGMATLLSGVITGLVVFIAVRVHHRPRRGRVLLQRPLADRREDAAGEAQPRDGRRDHRPRARHHDRHRLHART